MPHLIRGNPRALLDRILNEPHLPEVVPRLEAEVLHRVIQTCGLEDCGELVALATPAQLGRVFDLDLWRLERPGADEKFDAERFGVWLEVLMECGEEIAAEKLQGLDLHIVVTGLARHVAVFDRAAVSRAGEEIGGYLVETKRTTARDAIVGLLHFLNAEHSDYFHRLMAGCRSLSNSTPEADGFHGLLTDREQDMFDLSLARGARREQQGYITAAQSRAFLKLARDVMLTSDAPPACDPVSTAYFRSIDAPAPETADAVEEPAADIEIAAAGVVELLRDAGVITDQPRARLAAGAPGQTSRLARIEAHLRHAHDAGHDEYLARTSELAFLANVIVGGCSVQGRPFSQAEGADAALAICNLGLENWPGHWASPLDFVSVFQVGWKLLHGVAMNAAGHLIDVLSQMRFDDVEMQSGLDALRLRLIRGHRNQTPWAAEEALDVVATLDLLTWAALVGLIAQCPVMHGAIGASRDRHVRSVNPTAFEFISENSQLAVIREYLQSLAEQL